ncbi:flavin reductase [Anaerosacchariphilus polymeriproducens]|uniref:Flavin reductase family protein n=1 Tax=Anaerosacchariphilus polymeriproducens TaxID=1812858 RepID=A0A371AUQ1_9FIRM|nr:flavin reductase [Anaerosacchariphilus polymeriproducens]RDU23303.1 flavin reductase family protein [Anaerosacchariphilus polymeriproducens]
MSNFKEIKPEELQSNPFEIIGKEWMLVTAQSGDKINTMTASWGGVGVMWGKNVVFVVIRPQRFTKEIVDSAETLSLSFFGNAYREKLNYLGTVSGRDENKIKNSDLTVATMDSTPYFEEAHTVIIGKKLFAQQYDSQAFLDKSLEKQWYPDNDYHIMYICEIEKLLVTA